MSLLIQQLINGLMLGAIYVTCAVAFTLTIGILNFLNFTIPPLFMVAAMTAWAASAYGLPFGLTGPLPWLLALAVGILVVTFCSLVVERFTFRYLKARYGDATEHAIPLVSSLGFLLVLENLVRIAYGTEPHAFATTLGNPNWRVAGLIISLPQLASLCFALLAVLGLWLMLQRSRLGRALRAIAENPDAASLMGVRVTRIVPVIFVFSGILCGLAGALFAVSYGEVYAGMGDEVGTKAIAGMVLGGLGSIWGAIVGGLLVGIAETLAIHTFGADTVRATVWGLLLAVLLIRPQGIFGHHAIGKGKL